MISPRDLKKLSQGALSLKLADLRERLLSWAPLAIAFSGGLDSSFLVAFAAMVLEDALVALTISSPVCRPGSLEAVRAWAAKWGVKHVVFRLDHLHWPDFVRNDPRRCYYCKRNMYSHLLSWARQAGYRELADGTQVDDLGEDRPGLKAIEELAVKTPLLVAGFTKSEITEASEVLGVGLNTSFSGPCLATRIPTGTPISRQALRMVAEAERRLSSLGFKTLRVRYHGELARIEVLREDFPLLLGQADQIVYELKQIGFRYVSLDLEGWRRKLKGG
ncbi:ATP-dependent sacrificial sulfur transferase LarE [Thermosulfuriphilus sp.]